MKNIICLFLFCSFPLFALSQDRLTQSYPAEKIAPHTWVIHGPKGLPSVENQGFMNNPVFIVGQKQVIVIDPGSSVQAGRMVLDEIQKITTNPITHVFATHVHGDHWLGNQAIQEKYPQALFYAHPKMIQKAQDYAAKQWLATMNRLTENYTQATKAVIPTKKAVNGDEFTIDNIKIKIHAVDAAHSDSDIMLEIVNDQVLVLGDNVMYQRLGSLNDATFKGNIAACDMALKTNATIFVPGHGTTKGKKIVQLYQQYLQQIYQLAKKYYAEDLADYEMKPLIIKALPPIYSTWSGFKGQIGRHIIKAAQEVEASEF